LYVLKLYAHNVASCEVCDANHFNALQEPCRLPEEGTNSHCAARRSMRERSVSHIAEKLERSQDRPVLKHVQCYFVFLSYREHLLYVLKKVTILKASKNQGTRCRKKRRSGICSFHCQIRR